MHEYSEDTPPCRRTQRGDWSPFPFFLENNGLPLAVGLGSKSQTIDWTRCSHGKLQGLSDVGPVQAVDIGIVQSGHSVSTDDLSGSQGTQDLAAGFLLVGLGIRGVFRTGSRYASQGQCDVAFVGRCGSLGVRDFQGVLGFGYSSPLQKRYSAWKVNASQAHSHVDYSCHLGDWGGCVDIFCHAEEVMNW